MQRLSNSYGVQEKMKYLLFFFFGTVAQKCGHIGCCILVAAYNTRRCRLYIDTILSDRLGLPFWQSTTASLVVRLPKRTNYPHILSPNDSEMSSKNCLGCLNFHLASLADELQELIYGSQKDTIDTPPNVACRMNCRCILLKGAPGFEKKRPYFKNRLK